MQGLFEQLRQLIPLERALAFAVAFLIFLAGYGVARLARSGVRSLAGHRMTERHAGMVGSVVFYLIVLLALAEALTHVGLDLSVALGAAGIFTVAIGFAAQTSASNLISGLFLIAERPFRIGDSIQVGATSG